MEIDGVVVSMNNGIFLVDIAVGDDPENIVSCTLSGKIRKNSVRILVDDRVKIEITPYDLTKGRIIYRYKK